MRLVGVLCVMLLLGLAVTVRSSPTATAPGALSSSNQLFVPQRLNCSSQDFTLQCFLQRLVLHFPNIPVGGADHILIYDLQCSTLDLAGLPSVPVSASQLVVTTLGLGLSCSGAFNGTHKGIFKENPYNGNLTLSLSTKASTAPDGSRIPPEQSPALNFTMELLSEQLSLRNSNQPPDSYYLTSPQLLNISQCRSAVEVSRLEFGLMSKYIVDLEGVAAAITNITNEVLCTVFRDLVVDLSRPLFGSLANVTTHLFATDAVCAPPSIASAAQSTSEPAPSSPSACVNTEDDYEIYLASLTMQPDVVGNAAIPLVNWATVPLIAPITKLLNSFLNADRLSQCMGLEALISWLTHGTGTLSIDFPVGESSGATRLLSSLFTELLAVRFSAATNRTPANEISLHADVLQLNVSGLETVNGVMLMEPTHKGLTLSTLVSLEQLSFSLSIHLQAAVNGDRLDETFTFAITTRNLSLSVELLVLLNAGTLSQIQLEQVLAPQLFGACLLSLPDLLYAVNISSLGISVDLANIDVTSTSTLRNPDDLLAGELDSLVDSIVNLFLDPTYSAVTSSFVYGLMNGPVRTELNRVITDTFLAVRTRFDNESSFSTSPFYAQRNSSATLSPLSPLSVSSPYFPCHVTNSSNIPASQLPPSTHRASYPYLWFDNSTVWQLLDTVLNDALGWSGINRVLQCLVSPPPSSTPAVSLSPVSPAREAVLLQDLEPVVSYITPPPPASPFPSFSAVDALTALMAIGGVQLATAPSPSPVFTSLLSSSLGSEQEWRSLLTVSSSYLLLDTLVLRNVQPLIEQWLRTPASASSPHFPPTSESLMRIVSSMASQSPLFTLQSSGGKMLSLSLTIHGFDTFYEWDLFSPASHFDLASILALANCSLPSSSSSSSSANATCTPFTLALRISIDFSQLLNELTDLPSATANAGDDVVAVELSVQLSRISLQSMLHLVLNWEALGVLTFAQLLTPSCLLTAIPQFDLGPTLLALDDIAVNVEITDSGNGTHTHPRNHSHPLLIQMHSVNFTHTVNGILNATFAFVRTRLNALVQSSLGDSAATCANGGATSNADSTASVLYWLIPTMFVAALALFILIFKCCFSSKSELAPVEFKTPKPRDFSYLDAFVNRLTGDDGVLPSDPEAVNARAHMHPPTYLDDHGTHKGMNGHSKHAHTNGKANANGYARLPAVDVVERAETTTTATMRDRQLVVDSGATSSISDRRITSPRASSRVTGGGGDASSALSPTSASPAAAAAYYGRLQTTPSGAGSALSPLSSPSPRHGVTAEDRGDISDGVLGTDTEEEDDARISPTHVNKDASLTATQASRISPAFHPRALRTPPTSQTKRKHPPKKSPTGAGHRLDYPTVAVLPPYDERDGTEPALSPSTAYAKAKAKATGGTCCGNCCEDSLMQQPSVPWWASVIMVVCILSNIAMFLYSNNTLGADVRLYITLKDPVQASASSSFSSFSSSDSSLLSSSFSSAASPSLSLSTDDDLAARSHQSHQAYQLSRVLFGWLASVPGARRLAHADVPAGVDSDHSGRSEDGSNGSDGLEAMPASVTIELPSLFQFSLVNTVRDMWQARVYPLSIIIGFFSGGWPYIKLLMMLFAWVAPYRWCSSPARETLLMWLDRLGKWSLIDNFVLVLMVVAFRFHFGILFLDADVIVSPGVGFYTFLAATMMSLLISHVMLGVHRQSQTTICEDDGEATPLRLHTHTRQKEAWCYKHAPCACVRRERCSACGQFSVLLWLLASLGVVTYGILFQAFNFQFEGMAGLILGPRAVSPYSLWSVGTDLPGSTKDPDSFGTRWVQASFYLFAMGMPFAYLLTLLALWMGKLTLRRQRRLFVVSEICYAWSALDVFIASVISALLQLSQFAQFIIGDKCDAIDKILGMRCFDVVATLNEGCWILFGASVEFIIVGLFLSRLCHSAMTDRGRGAVLLSNKDKIPSDLHLYGDDSWSSDLHPNGTHDSIHRYSKGTSDSQQPLLNNQIYSS